MKKIMYLFAVVSLTALASCGKTETKTITSASVEMIEEYPMEGSNTLTGVWQVDLAGINIDKVKEAKVTAIKVNMVEPASSDQLAEIIMQLAASGTDMQRVGILNPVPVSNSSLEMAVASKQNNLLDLLKQEEITFVADINLKEDLTAELSVTATIEFELEVKQ